MVGLEVAHEIHLEVVPVVELVGAQVTQLKAVQLVGL